MESEGEENLSQDEDIEIEEYLKRKKKAIPKRGLKESFPSGDGEELLKKKRFEWFIGVSSVERNQRRFAFSLYSIGTFAARICLSEPGMNPWVLLLSRV